MVLRGIARANLHAGNTKAAGRDSRSPACDRGQFAATVRGTEWLASAYHLRSGVPLVFRRATACGGSVSLAHIGT
jgi:hypothetical protein